MDDERLMTVVHLFISPGHNFFGHYGRNADQYLAEEVSEIHCLAGRGIEGDRFFDHKEDYKGQITFFEWEVYDALRRDLGVYDVSPSAFRRNMITRGVDLNKLIGAKFEVQGVRFEGSRSAARVTG